MWCSRARGQTELSPGRRDSEVRGRGSDNPAGPRILYVDTYTVQGKEAQSIGGAGPVSSDAIGYGVTCSDAIVTGLRARGCELLVVRPRARGPATDGARLQAIHRTYSEIAQTLRRWQPDAVLLFHSFTVFATEIRRTMCDLGVRAPILGYTHGSHWDPSDSFRINRYPGLELADLANLAAMDRVFVVSEYMRATLAENLRRVSRGIADQIMAKVVTVGLPLNTDRIDREHTRKRSGVPTIVFNHAPVASKRPDIFVRVMEHVMPVLPVNVVLTRRFASGDFAAAEVARFAARFGHRVTLGNDMRIGDYYRSLWQSHIQVSTAEHESLGVATLEAMYTGNCCIVPSTGSYTEICGEATEALYDPGEEGLLKRLMFFLDDSQRRRALARRLRAQAERFGPDLVVAKIFSSVAEII